MDVTVLTKGHDICEARILSSQLSQNGYILFYIHLLKLCNFMFELSYNLINISTVRFMHMELENYIMKLPETP